MPVSAAVASSTATKAMKPSTVTTIGPDGARVVEGVANGDDHGGEHPHVGDDADDRSERRARCRTPGAAPGLAEKPVVRTTCPRSASVCRSGSRRVPMSVTSAAHTNQAMTDTTTAATISGVSNWSIAPIPAASEDRATTSIACPVERSSASTSSYTRPSSRAAPRQRCRKVDMVRLPNVVGGHLSRWVD